MAQDEVKATDVKQQKLETDEAKEQAVDVPDVKQSNVPYYRFKEVNDQLVEMKETVSKLKADEEAKQAQIKIEKGEYKELYEKEVESRKAAEVKISKADEYFKTRKKQIMSDWSKEDVELYGDLPFEKLERHNDSLKKTKAVKVNTSKAGVSGGKQFKGDLWDDSDSESLKAKREGWGDIIKQRFHK
jgi:hypothetical protein